MKTFIKTKIMNSNRQTNNEIYRAAVYKILQAIILGQITFLLKLNILTFVDLDIKLLCLLQ